MSESKKDLKQVRKQVEDIRLLLAGHWMTQEKSALGEMARLTLELCNALLDLIDAAKAANGEQPMSKREMRKKTNPQAPKSPEQIIEQLSNVAAGFWWAHDCPDGLSFFLFALSQDAATLAELVLSPSAPDSENKAG